MQYHDLDKLREAKECLAAQFKDLPMRSRANSIIKSLETWNAYEPGVLSAFKRIKTLAQKVRRAEYEWVRKVVGEMERELQNIRLKLAECELGWPPKQDI